MTFFSANMFVSIFSAGALQYLWGLINALQVLVLTALFQLDLAPNADMVMVAVLKMAALEFVSGEQYIDMIFGMRETHSFDYRGEVDESVLQSTKFADAGYESSNYIELLGPLFFIVCGYAVWRVLMIFLTLIFKPCPDCCCSKRLHSMQKNQPETVMRFFLEGCVEIGLSAIISIMMMDEKVLENEWETVSTILAFISLVMLVFAPIYYLKIVNSYLKE